MAIIDISARALCGRMADLLLSASARTFIVCNAAAFIVGVYAFVYGASVVMSSSDTSEVSLPALLLIAGGLTCAVSTAGFIVVILPTRRKSSNAMLFFMLCLVCASALNFCFGLSFIFSKSGSGKSKKTHGLFGLAFIFAAVFQSLCVAVVEKQRKWLISNSHSFATWESGDGGCLKSVTTVINGGTGEDVTLAWPSVSSPEKPTSHEDEVAKRYYEPRDEEIAICDDGDDDDGCDDDDSASETDALNKSFASKPPTPPGQVRSKYAMLRQKYKLPQDDASV